MRRSAPGSSTVPRDASGDGDITTVKGPADELVDGDLVPVGGREPFDPPAAAAEVPETIPRDALLLRK